jgi:hypothetical protein
LGLLFELLLEELREEEDLDERLVDCLTAGRDLFLEL